MFSSLQALSFKMKIEDHREVFKQLYFARYGEAPYDKFGDWKDQNLWVKLFEVLKEQLSFEYGQNTLISLILDFAKKYADDPKMNWIKDQSLRNHVHAVFSSEPLKDSKGRLSMEAIEGCNSTNIHNPEGVGESSCSHGGRNFFKRSRGAGSSSGNNFYSYNIENRDREALYYSLHVCVYIITKCPIYRIQISM
jgi:hypothetical protein